MSIAVEIDDDLLEVLKERARQENVSISSKVNEAIRDGLRAEAQPAAKKPFKQVTHDMGEPLIDITKATAIAFEWEDEETIRKMGLGQ
jgi:hypothetical protein